MRRAFVALWIVTLGLAGAYSLATAGIPALPPEIAAVAGGIIGAALGWWRRPT